MRWREVRRVPGESVWRAERSAEERPGVSRDQACAERGPCSWRESGVLQRSGRIWSEAGLEGVGKTGGHQRGERFRPTSSHLCVIEAVCACAHSRLCASASRASSPAVARLRIVPRFFDEHIPNRSRASGSSARCWHARRRHAWAALTHAWRRGARGRVMHSRQMLSSVFRPRPTRVAHASRSVCFSLGGDAGPSPGHTPCSTCQHVPTHSHRSRRRPRRRLHQAKWRWRLRRSADRLRRPPPPEALPQPFEALRDRSDWRASDAGS
jgi:hypothetical protein